jgi:hypothetical protein
MIQQASEQQRSLGELFSELARETGTLVRKEMELAKTEMTAKAATARKDILLVAYGWSLGLAGVLALLAAIILALGTLISLWVSALLVGALVTATGVTLVGHGFRALNGIDPMPRETIQTLKEDKQWIREQTSR